MITEDGQVDKHVLCVNLILHPLIMTRCPIYPSFENLFSHPRGLENWLTCILYNQGARIYHIISLGVQVMFVSVFETALRKLSGYIVNSQTILHFPTRHTVFHLTLHLLRNNASKKSCLLNVNAYAKDTFWQTDKQCEPRSDCS